MFWMRNNENDFPIRTLIWGPVSDGLLLVVFQLLKHVTIASGGVLPRIHPELIVRKKGGKVVNVITPPKKKAASVAAAKALTLLKPTTAAPVADKGKKKGGKKLKVTTVSVCRTGILTPMSLVPGRWNIGKAACKSSEFGKLEWPEPFLCFKSS